MVSKPLPGLSHRAGRGSFLFLCVILLCGYAAEAGEKKVDRILVVRGDQDYPLYQFLDESGRPTGFDVDVFRAIAATMGLRADITLGPWPTVRKQIEAGEVDAVVGMLHSEQRQRLVDFAESHLTITHAVFVRKGSPIRSIEDIRGKDVIVVEDDIMHDVLRQEGLGANVIPVGSPTRALRLLAAGKHDCALLARLHGMSLMHRYGIEGVKCVGPPIQPCQYGIAVRKGDAALKAELNEGLSIIRESGEYDRIYHKWFGDIERRSVWASLRYVFAALGAAVGLLCVVSLWSWSLRCRVRARTAELVASQEAFQKTDRALRMLSECNQDLVRAEDESALLRKVCENVVRIGGYVAARVSLCGGHDDAVLTPVADAGDAAACPQMCRLAGPSGEACPMLDAFHGREPLILRDVPNNPAAVACRPNAEARGYRSIIFLPLALAGEKIGVLGIGATEEDAFDEQELRLLTELADDLAFGTLALRTKAERARAEAQVRHERDRAQQYLDIARVMFVVLDDEGIVLLANRMCTTVLGCEEAELIGANWFRTCLPPDIRDEMLHYHRTVMQGDGSPVQYHENLVLTKSGELRMIAWQNAAINDPAGGRVSVLSCGEDITERKRAEEEIERLAKFPAENPNPVMRLSREGRLLYANEAAAPLRELFGAAPGELLSESWRSRMEQILGEGRDCVIELVCGDQTFSLFCFPVSGTDYMNLYGMDITERHKLEDRALQANKLESIGRLAGGVAHDFNNILTVILGYGRQVLQSEGLTRDERKKLSIVCQQGFRAVELVRQILDFSRQSISNPISLDLRGFINENAKILKRIIPESVDIQFEFGHGTFVVTADPTQIQQILTNLVVNARDALPTGGEIKVSLSRRCVEAGQTPPCPDMPPGDWVCFSIVDTGSGIAADKLPYIFDPFFTTKEVGKGTGLGLAQVYGLVKKHNGFIEVDSASGQGTAFRIYLPALQGVGLLEHDTPEPIMHGRGETVLLVEDDTAVREAMRMMLSELDYRVLTAANGVVALQLYQDYRESIRLVLSDVVMPEMGGIELLGKLRELDPDVKVILTTGYPLRMEGTDSAVEGLAEILRKPIVLSEMAAMLRSLLDE